MSIVTLKEQLLGIPRVETLTMAYAEGGRSEVYSIAGGKSVTVPAGATADEIRKALEAA